MFYTFYVDYDMFSIKVVRIKRQNESFRNLKSDKNCVSAPSSVAWRRTETLVVHIS